jgi:hypothetical protein
MNARQDSRVRMGVAGLLISALLFSACVLMRGKSIIPTVDPVGWAAAAAQKNTYRSWYFAIIAQVLQVFGVLGLWAFLARKGSERLAFTGAMMTVAGAVLVMPLFGFLAFIAPTVGRVAQQDQGVAIQIASAMFVTPVSLAFLGVSGLLYIVGSLLLAVAMWRARVVPRAIPVLYFVQAPLLVVAPNHTLEIAAVLALTVASAVIAVRVWTDSAGDNAPAESTRSAGVTANT